MIQNRNIKNVGQRFVNPYKIVFPEAVKGLKENLKKCYSRRVVVRGVIGPQKAPRGGRVVYNQTSVNRLEVYCDGEFVGIDNHVNFFSTQFDQSLPEWKVRELQKLMRNLKEGDNVEISGVVVQYNNKGQQVSNYSIEQIDELIRF